MASIYLRKICVHFLELLLLKRNENAIFFLKITQNKIKDSFFKLPDFLYIFVGCK